MRSFIRDYVRRTPFDVVSLVMADHHEGFRRLKNSSRYHVSRKAVNRLTHNKLADKRTRVNPRERRGDRGVPPSERVGGSAGAKPTEHANARQQVSPRERRGD